MIRRQFLPLQTPTRRDRRPRRQPFKAIPVIRTAPRERIRRPIVRHPNMPHLRMRQPMQNTSAHDRATADPRADREIQAVRNPARRAPPRFAQHSRVHIRIEANRHAEAATYRARQIAIPPRGLRRGRNEAPRRRFRTRSTGPNEPMPTARRLFWPSQAIVRASVSAGEVVGICVLTMSSGPVPAPQTNLVPPASIAPNIYSRLSAAHCLRFNCGSGLSA